MYLNLKLSEKGNVCKHLLHDNNKLLCCDANHLPGAASSPANILRLQIRSFSNQVFSPNALHSSQTHIFIVNGQVPQLRCLRSSRGSRAVPGHFDEASSLMSHSLSSGTGYREGQRGAQSGCEPLKDSDDWRTEAKAKNQTSPGVYFGST